MTFAPNRADYGSTLLAIVVAGLSVSFVAASLLAFRYTNSAIRVFYRAAAVWLGFLTFLFSAAAASWIVYTVARLFGKTVDFHVMTNWLFAAALVVGVYGLFNARWTRVTRAT